EAIADVVVRRPRAVLALVLTGVLVAACGIARLHVNSSFRSWFGPDAPVIVADRMIRTRFTGTSTIRLLVEADVPEGLLDPRVMAGMDELQRMLAAEPDVTATLSVVDFVKVMNRALHDGAPDALRVPESRNLIAQYLLLYGPADLARVVSAD